MSGSLRALCGRLGPQNPLLHLHGKVQGGAHSFSSPSLYLTRVWHAQFWLCPAVVSDYVAAQVKRKKGEEVNEAEEEERCVSIISSLLSNLARGSRRDRTCAKFVENEFEKCDHIMELYTRYDARVRAEEVRCRARDPR